MRDESPRRAAVARPWRRASPGEFRLHVGAPVGSCGRFGARGAHLAALPHPEKSDSRLDRSLAATFPASDPLPAGPRPSPAEPPPPAIIPGAAAPHLVLPTVDGQIFSLHQRRPPRFTMPVAYRGRHCPVCREYLRELQEILPQYERRGVQAFAFSMDDLHRARSSREAWGIEGLELGYSLSEDIARRWGLFLSDSIDDAEPRRFSEPGLFLVRPDGVLHYASIQSMPFGRPELSGLLESIEYILTHDYPPRGRVV